MGIFAGLGADSYDRDYSDRYLIGRLFSYLRPYQGQVWLVVLITFLFGAMGAIIPVTIAWGVDVLGTDDPAAGLPLVLVALAAIAVIDYVLYRQRRLLTARLIATLISRLRKDAFNAALERDMVFYDDNKSGKIVSRITSDTQELNQLSLVVTDLVSQFLEFALILIILFTREWRLTLMTMAMIPTVILLTVVFRYFARIVTRQGSRMMAVVNDNIQETVTGISVAKNFRQEAMIYDTFADVNTQSYNVNLRRGLVLATVFPVLNMMIGFFIAAVTYFGAMAVYDGSINIGAWYLFVQSLDRFFFPIINLSSFWSQMQQGLSAIERIFALIDADNTVVQRDRLPAPADMRGGAVFEKVAFAYKPGLPAVLHDFDLTIAPGESIAFVGHTGAGKTTIGKLLSRFYEFQEGTIRVDGIDIRDFDLTSYRGRLGIVPQQPFLFSGTVMDNIRYARPEVSDAEISAIATSIGGGEWLEALPEGLQTHVGERGARLSMGQRQLVSLLRVLVQRPAIFILDEATASIDPFTELQIQEALDQILAQSTSILIAHRLSTVRAADRIIVLREGQIIEQGDHDHLMAQGGHYADLYNTYFRHQSLSYIENAKDLLTQE